MKKVLVIPSFYPVKENSNKGIFFREQTEYLNSTNYKMAVIYPELRSIREININGIKNNHFQYSQMLENNIMVYRKHSYNIIPTKYYIGNLIWVNNVKKMFKKYIQENGVPDFIHAHCCLWAGLAALEIYKEFSVPYIVTEHSSSFLKKNISEREKRVCQEVFKYASKVIAVSESLKKSIINILDVNNCKIDVIPNFIDTDFFSIKEIKNEKFTLFALGNLNDNKRFDRLINAFYKAKKEMNINCTLRIGGEGPSRSELESLIKNNDLNKEIVLLGRLNREEVRKEMQRCSCFILTSDVETFGIVFIEAMSCGKPIIATKCGGPEEFLDESLGILVDKNIDSVKDSIITMIKEYNRYDKKNIRAYIQNNYSKEKVKQKIYSIYKDINL